MSFIQRLKEEFKKGDLLQLASSYGKEYIQDIQERHIFPMDEDLEMLSRFDEDLPLEIGNAKNLIDQLYRSGSPNTVAMLGGRYFGFVNGSVLPVGLAARWIADSWDQNTAMQVISPICSRLETVTQRWLVELFGLPKATVAGFVSGTSMATFCGLAAGRIHLLEKLDWDWAEKGMYGAPRLRIVTSRQAHSTVVKALNLLGFGRSCVEWIDVDDQGRIDVSQLPELDETTIVVVQAGNVNSGSFDNFKEVCTKANEAGSWVHIDGAFGLWAQCVSSKKHLTDGMELADSWSVDGHKTLNTPYDNGIILCKHPHSLTSALHMSGSYIVQGQQRDGMYYTPEMSRRARIIELWATIKYLGVNGIDTMIQNMCDRAIQFGAELESHNFQILNEIVFNQVLVACDNDEITEQTLRYIQQERICWCGPSNWQGRRVIRISVCSWATTSEDVRKSVGSFVRSREKALA